MTPGEGDDDLWQLRVTLRFDSTPELTELGSGDRWCGEPAEVEAFGEFIRASAPFALRADRGGDQLVIELERAG